MKQTKSFTLVYQLVIATQICVLCVLLQLEPIEEKTTSPRACVSESQSGKLPSDKNPQTQAIGNTQFKVHKSANYFKILIGTANKYSFKSKTGEFFCQFLENELLLRLEDKIKVGLQLLSLHFAFIAALIHSLLLLRFTFVLLYQLLKVIFLLLQC